MISSHTICAVRGEGQRPVIQDLVCETFTMEYEAEFSEDQDAYFPQELIRSCINPELEYLEESRLLPTQPP